MFLSIPEEQNGNPAKRTPLGDVLTSQELPEDTPASPWEPLVSPVDPAGIPWGCHETPKDHQETPRTASFCILYYRTPFRGGEPALRESSGICGFVRALCWEIRRKKLSEYIYIYMYMYMYICPHARLYVRPISW